MSKNEWKKLVGVAGRMLLVFVFVFSQTAWAGQNPQTKDKADSQQKAGSTKRARSSPLLLKARRRRASKSKLSTALETMRNGRFRGVLVGPG